MVVTTVGAKYTSLITTSSVRPSIRQLITILAIPTIGSSPDAVEMNVSSLSGWSGVIALSRLLQIWQAAPLSQTILSLSGCRPVVVLLMYSELATSPLRSLDFCGSDIIKDLHVLELLNNVVETLVRFNLLFYLGDDFRVRFPAGCLVPFEQVRAFSQGVDFPTEARPLIL